MADFVTLDSYFTSQEAHLVRNKLEAAGIDCVILNELSSQIYNFHSPSNGGILLKVRNTDLQAALDLLAEDSGEMAIDENFEVGPLESDLPNRGSQTLQLEKRNNWPLLIFALAVVIALAYLIATQYSR